jgi:hypothetical protein
MVIELAASYYFTFDIVSEYMEFVVLSIMILNRVGVQCGDDKCFVSRFYTLNFPGRTTSTHQF